MTDKPSEHDPLADLIEFCPPGGPDAGDPALAPLTEQLAARAELAARLEAVQRADAAMAEAFADVPVPAGLAERLLARLAEASSPSQTAPVEERPVTGADVEAGAEGAMVGREAGHPKRKRMTRRRWLAAGALVAAAASIAAVLLLPWQAPPAYTAAAVLELALERFASEEFQGLPGEPLASAPAAFPMSDAVAVPLPERARWRPIDDFLGRRGVAYDLVGPGGTRATLYTVRPNIENLPVAPAHRPALSTGGRSTSAWQHDGYLYVLVVDGPASAYVHFLDLPTGPLT